MRSVQRILHSVQCTMNSVEGLSGSHCMQPVRSTGQCTLDNVCCTTISVHCLVLTNYCSVYVYAMFTQKTVQCSLTNTLPTVGIPPFPPPAPILPLGHLSYPPSLGGPKYRLVKEREVQCIKVHYTAVHCTVCQYSEMQKRTGYTRTVDAVTYTANGCTADQCRVILSRKGTSVSSVGG